MLFSIKYKTSSYRHGFIRDKIVSIISYQGYDKLHDTNCRVPYRVPMVSLVVFLSGTKFWKLMDTTRYVEGHNHVVSLNHVPESQNVKFKLQTRLFLQPVKIWNKMSFFQTPCIRLENIYLLNPLCVAPRISLHASISGHTCMQV